jgi:hypothetical protein
VTITYVLTMYLTYIYPLPHSPSSFHPPFLGFTILFSYMNAKYIHSVCPPSSSLFTLPLTRSNNPPTTGPTLHS